MKSGIARSLLALAVTSTSMEGSTSKPMKLRPPLPIPNCLLDTRTRPSAGASPRYNQRKVRKARRVRHSQGIKNAFK